MCVSIMPYGFLTMIQLNLLAKPYHGVLKLTRTIVELSEMRAAMSQIQLSARAYQRILKLARTIADLAGSEEI